MAPRLTHKTVAQPAPRTYPRPLDTQPWLRAEPVDGTGRLANGIRYRLRIRPSGPLCAFVIWALEAP